MKLELSTSTRLLIFSIFLLHFQTLVTIHCMMIAECYNSSNYSSGSPFEANLKTMLTSLSINGVLRHDTFYNATYGDDPYSVYGFSQCMSGASEYDCRQCLINSTVEIVQECPGRTQATTNFSKYETTYGLAQCTRDLSKEDCYACLRSIVDAFKFCCYGKSGGNVYTVSCNIRYETYPFYNLSDSPLSLLASSNIPTQGNEGKVLRQAGNGERLWKIVLIILKAVTIAVALFIFIGCCYLQRKKNACKGMSLFHGMDLPNGIKFMDEDIDGGDQVDNQGLPLISLSAIQAATNNFSNESLLGRGGFGPGLLPNGKEIAVKRLARTSGQGLEEFKNEIILIAKLQHRNLARLLYCCMENEEKLLVYEYMPNTSLNVFIYDSIKRVHLDWKKRLHIICGIARGILYLHEDSRLRIIHRDLKASNILLDNEMNPKISDFGLARIFGGNQNEANTKRVVGTYGYMAPEYAMAGLFSVKSDVFSFGILLLEIVSGKRNTSHSLPGQAQSLLTYAWRLWCDGKGLELMDDLIQETSSANEVLRCIHIGLLCVQEDPADRPTMSSVVAMLTSNSMALAEPTNPGFFVSRAVAESNQSPDEATWNQSMRWEGDSQLFSFGVLLLEIMTGKKNSSFHNSDNTQNLPQYVSKP
ncbi:cysteine-rich receptor-like protein kinase 10 [Cinnamomum micranthum f. kanehirae]|uniref:Cysteine-rich receptor-like protein kinase 10 n=1 Tax=Cinnamomum micranthum f. kanehirae TaxID=337451 RepID=A0A443PC20_9MAGN|nr:cysteine-rich receptor-like protein kinase 10 [Cinnamomum micranthum f. kanehirae]